MAYTKYTQGNIYKITDNAYSECYIGSTVQALSNIMRDHRNDYKRCMDNKTGGYNCAYNIFNNYGLQNCKIELVELAPCNNQLELRQRDGYYIQTMVCINKVVAGSTKQHPKADNRDILLEYQAQ